MKIITLVPVKNEAWILESALENFSRFSDAIIVADQMSTDGSRDICKKFPKVTLIDNAEIGHSNKVRWMLLDAARKIEGNNLLISIDADEAISPKLFEDKEFLSSLNKGDVLEFKWIQLWKSFDHYRDDGAWRNSYKQIGFVDDRTSDYLRIEVINDHTNRIPAACGKIIRPETPLLHYQFIPWEQTQMKQAWYRCSELIARSASARKINYKYAPTLDTECPLKPTPSQWVAGLKLPFGVERLPASWHHAQILSWFDRHGIAFFEPLQIWHIHALREEFMRKTGQQPRAKTYPKFVIWANSLKNLILSAARF